jgi:hypothetical protein
MSKSEDTTTTKRAQIHLNQPHHKHVQQLHLCWNQHPCCQQLAHIFHLSLEVGDKQLNLHNFNQGTHFYYKIQLQLQIIRILL